MTNDGLARLTTLFKNDILKVEYDVDGVTSENTDLTFVQVGNDLKVQFFIGDVEIGVIDNFKLIGTTVTLDIRNKSYEKLTDDQQRITLPYRLEVKVV